MSTTSRPVSLHELLAIEKHLDGQAAKTRTQLAATFTGKRHLFEEKVVSFTATVDGHKNDSVTEKSIQSTVQSELDWITPYLAKAMDAGLQVAEANTNARADIVLEDGATLATNVPATALLELEKRANEIKLLLEAIPTLDPAKGFDVDANHKMAGKGVYRARDIRKTRTQKTREVLVLVPATKEHPAQAQLVDKDIPIGTIEEQEWSGLITPAAKADLISRIETIIRAVKQARSRANHTTVDTTRQIGDKLLGYVINGKL